MAAIHLKHGWYRRIYAGFITGKRINAVSEGAEMWFWRCHAIADDYGNFPADAEKCHSKAAGLRRISVGRVAKFLDELARAELIRTYGADGDTYAHIIDFQRLQTAARRNGKVWRQYPPSPWDDRPAANLGKNGGADDEGCGQVRPGAARCIQAATQTKTNTKTKPPAVAVTYEGAGGGGGEVNWDVGESRRILADAGVGAAGKYADLHPPEVCRAAVAHARKGLRPGDAVNPAFVVCRLNDGTAAEYAGTLRRKAAADWLRTPPGREWALTSLTVDGRAIDADSLRKVLQAPPREVIEAAAAAMGEAPGRAAS